MLISLYSIFVGLQVIISAYNVRKILLAESKLTGRYKMGIKKLTRVIVLVVCVEVIGNASLFTGIANNVQTALEYEQFSEEPRPFDLNYIAMHFSTLVAIWAVMLGGWKISEVAANTSGTPASADKKKRSKTTAAAAASTENSQLDKRKGMESPTPPDKKNLEAMPLDNV